MPRNARLQTLLLRRALREAAIVVDTLKKRVTVTVTVTIILADVRSGRLLQAD